MSTLWLAELVALVGGTVHTLVPGEEPRVATVLIRDGRIEAIGPDLELPEGPEGPEEIVRIDVAGLHLVPGLIDALVSFDPDHDALYCAAGVTVVRDVGGSRVRSLFERASAARDRTPGPTLYTCGAVLDGDPPGSPDAAIVRNAVAAETLLPILFEEHVDFLCVQMGLGEEAWRKVLELAHEKGVRVWGPVPAGIALRTALEAGQDGLHHLDRLVPDGSSWQSIALDALDEQVQALAASGTPIVPTLAATALRLTDQSQTREPEFLALLAPSYEAWWREDLAQRMRAMDDATRASGVEIVAKQRALLARLEQAGAVLVPGSGAPHPWLLPGQSLHRELAAWVEAGLAPERVLELATRRSAEALGIADRHGVLAAGRQADLVCSAEDPRQSLAGLAQPELVVVRGTVLRRADLDQRLAALAEHQKKERAALDVPLDFEPPALPDGARILSGTVESRALGQRVAAERFAVVRAADGALVLVGRVRHPRGDEFTVVQTLRNGLLDQLRVDARIGGRVLVVEGLWTAERFRLRRTADGVTLDTQSFREHPVCADLASVTALFALGQRGPDRGGEAGGERGSASVLTFHELFEPESVRWEVQVEEDGDYVVHTHNTAMAFRFDEHGAPLLFRTRVGQGLVEAKLIEADAFGGSGLAPQRSATRASAAPAEAVSPH